MTLTIPHQQRLPLAIAALGFLFLGLFLLYPLFNVFGASVLDGDGEKFTFANYVKILGRPFYRGAVANTLMIGVAATITTIVISVPFAFALARLPVPGKAAIVALAAMPLVLPSFVSAYAIVLLLGRAGVVTQWLNSWGIGFGSIYGAGGIVLVYTLTLYPYVLLPTMAGFKAVDVSIEEAAQSLGSSPRRTLWTVTLPIVVPSILAGGLLVFIETLENFGVPFVLAEDMPIFAVEAFKLFVGETAPNPSSAGVLGVLLILMTSLVLLIQRRFLANRRFATGARSAPPILKVGPGLRIAATVYCWSVVLLALVPFFAIVVLSFMEFRGPVLHPNFSTANFTALFERSTRPLLNTLMFATLAAIGVTLIGVPIAYVVTRLRSGLAAVLDVIATLPFAVAGTVLAIGFVVSFNSGWLILTGGPFIMVLAYTVRKIPFAVRSSSGILHQIDPSLEEASISLGRSPLQTFARILVPLMLGGIMSGFVLTWVTIASELSATVVLYSGQWRTLTVVMFQALEGGGGGIATAAASTLIVVTLVPIALLYRLIRRYELAA
ncbi:iron ABC transporter permease [Reyranella aquatilis]|uniref:Iron ABC transporter permease n=1 Tax=Reyranella aquatilis TaxID=2035356 RepID=A0ABS8KXB9_9HYPH|nr:iron ABC transporter permease [Reyranella aquatilis]MCC8430751.1 iron ABC transporter permease [Reyranella aquatilis]